MKYRSPSMQSLEELVIQTRLLSPMQLAVAQRDAQLRQKRLAATIVDLGMVNDRRFAEWMAEQTQVPIVDPLPAEDAQIHAGRVPGDLARRYEILPIGLSEDTLIVATVDPLDRSSFDLLHAVTATRIRPVIAVYGPLKELLDRLYPDSRPGPDPDGTMAAPFEFGSETLMAYRAQPTLFDPEEELGSATRVIPSPPPPAAGADDTNPVLPAREMTAQLDRIERLLEQLQRRIDDIDAMLARIVNR